MTDDTCVCASCGCEMTYDTVGYDGPMEIGSTDCTSFMPWLILCKGCAFVRGIIKEKTHDV